MNAMFWLGVVELFIFALLFFWLIAELKLLRAVLAELLGSLAQASWRTKEELAAMNKKNS